MCSKQIASTVRDQLIKAAAPTPTSVTFVMYQNKVVLVDTLYCISLYVCIYILCRKMYLSMAPRCGGEKKLCDMIHRHDVLSWGFSNDLLCLLCVMLCYVMI